MELKAAQRETFVAAMASALAMIDEGPYDQRSDMGGVNDFQKGRAHGLFEGIVLLVPKEEWQPMLEDARCRAQTMTHGQASKMWLTKDGTYDAWFRSFIRPFDLGTA